MVDYIIHGLEICISMFQSVFLSASLGRPRKTLEINLFVTASFLSFSDYSIVWRPLACGLSKKVLVRTAFKLLKSISGIETHYLQLIY